MVWESASILIDWQRFGDICFIIQIAKRYLIHNGSDSAFLFSLQAVSVDWQPAATVWSKPYSKERRENASKLAMETNIFIN